MTHSGENPGTLIIGGGSIGLAIGWKLARRGEQVTLLERGRVGREASFAAAGMLAIANEVHFQEDLNLLLRQESMKIYGAFVEELEAAVRRSARSSRLSERTTPT